ncbi:hypothetical protein Q7P35_001571 [Cladosporium inversicolor]
MAGVKTIIVLSFILAIGFILVILSSALYHNFLTLLVVATYVLAPVPNWICSKAQSNDDFMDSGSSSIVELGRFLTGFFVVMGMALPIVLAHTEQIRVEAMVMSIIGGLLIYGTIISFTMFFREQEEF